MFPMAPTTQAVWIPFMRSDGPAWTAADVAAMIGDVREIDWLGALGANGESEVRILDGRLTRDPFRAEFLVEPT